MSPEDFVRACHAEKTAMLRRYFETPPATAVGLAIQGLASKPEDVETLRTIVDGVLDDAFRTLLYAFDGCASLGGRQRTYVLLDEDGTELTGELEAFAFERFPPA